VARDRAQQYIAAHQKPLKAALLVLIAAALVAPFLLVGYSHLKMQDGWTAVMRTAGILAYTLIFMNLVTGPLSKYFYMLFKAKQVQRFHIATGAIGFSLAVMHGVIVFIMHHYRDHPATWLIGPCTLGLLIVTMAVAANRKKLPALWRRVHQLNYLIFVAVFVKALLIGTTLTSESATGTATAIVMSLEMAAVVFATVVRIVTRPKKAPASKVVQAEAVVD
jgi:DMSO/TMAO reductase YedYZ heme-binding membrane subunit